MSPEDRMGLAPAVDEARLSETWRRIAGRKSAGKRRAPRVIAAVALGAAAVLAVALVAWPDPPGALVATEAGVSVAPGAVVEAVPAPEARELVLDDGSSVDLADDGRLEVLANDGQRFVALLQGGPARFEVTPGGPRAWTVETALASVEVVGTAFTVDPGAERLEVRVEHGVVLVRGERVPGRVARLLAGESLVVTRDEPEPIGTPDAADAAEAPVASPAAAEILGVPAAPTATVARAPLALPVGEALREADRLRAEGRIADAADVLERTVLADPHGPGAGLAAFTLGRLALDPLDQPERAARAFAVVLAEGRPASLVEDARARHAEALRRAGSSAP